MATIREILHGRNVYSVMSNNTVREAAVYMAERNVGAAPVISDSELVGVFSERDVVRRVLMEGRDWNTTTVGEVMTQNPLTVSPGEDVDRCMMLMKQNNFRHLPVTEGQRLVGFISMRELLLQDLDEKEVEVRMMRAYMSAGAES